MGFQLKVEGPSTIELGTTIITGVKFRTDIPMIAMHGLRIWAVL